MKVLATGDFHLDALTNGYPRQQEIVRAFDQIIHRVRSVEIELVLFLGDLCNPDKGSRTLRSVTAALDMFQRLVRTTNTRVIAISGNHDVVQDESELTSLSPLRYILPLEEPRLEGVKKVGNDTVCTYDLARRGVTVSERPDLFDVFGKLWVLTLPFVSSSLRYDPPSIVSEVGKSLKGSNLPLIVAGHLQLDGAMFGSETTDMSRGRDVAFPIKEAANYATLSLNGHYHKRQSIEGVQCPGSLVRLSFGEESNEPRWLEFDIDNGR